MGWIPRVIEGGRIGPANPKEHRRRFLGILGAVLNDLFLAEKENTITTRGRARKAVLSQTAGDIMIKTGNNRTRISRRA